MATPQSQSETITSGCVGPPLSSFTIMGLKGAWWKYGMGVLMTYVVYGAFFIAKGAANFGANGDTSRIVFFHVPVAILSYVCYVVATFYAIQYLIGRRWHSDMKSSTAMELGLLFCILTTVTGSIFSRAVWGAYWNWDPSQTRIVMMLLLYASYVVLRGATIAHAERRGRLSAVYALVTVVPATYLIWVVPRILETLHPTTVLTRPRDNSPAYNLILLVSFIAFTLLFIWMFQLRCRQLILAERRKRKLIGGTGY